MFQKEFIYILLPSWKRLRLFFSLFSFEHFYIRLIIKSRNKEIFLILQLLRFNLREMNFHVKKLQKEINYSQKHE